MPTLLRSRRGPVRTTRTSRRPTMRSPRPVRPTTTPFSRPTKKSRRLVPSNPRTRTTRKPTARKTTIWSGKHQKRSSGLVPSCPGFWVPDRWYRHVVECAANLVGQDHVGFGQDAEQLGVCACPHDRGCYTRPVAHPSQRHRQGRDAEAFGGRAYRLHDAGARLPEVGLDEAGEVVTSGPRIGRDPSAVLA